MKVEAIPQIDLNKNLWKEISEGFLFRRMMYDGSVSVDVVSVKNYKVMFLLMISLQDCRQGRNRGFSL